MKQTEIKFVLLLSLAIVSSRCQTQDCDFTNYIIPFNCIEFLCCFPAFDFNGLLVAPVGFFHQRLANCFNVSWMPSLFWRNYILLSWQSFFRPGVVIPMALAALWTPSILLYIEHPRDADRGSFSPISRLLPFFETNVSRRKSLESMLDGPRLIEATPLIRDSLGLAQAFMTQETMIPCFFSFGGQNNLFLIPIALILIDLNSRTKICFKTNLLQT